MRKFISIFMFLSFIVMLVSGVVLYIMPHGRVAYWTGWTLFGLGKDEWESLHMVFGLLMVISGIWHLVLNWKIFVNYVKSKSKVLLSKDFFIAFSFTFLVIIGTLFKIPPFKNFVELSEEIKSSWPQNKISSPAPHAELFSLEKVCNLLGISLEEGLKALKDKGFKIKSKDETLKEIAEKNKKTPYEVYDILQKYSQDKKENYFRGKGLGYGRLTLKDVCENLGISLEKGLSILKNKGIEASADKSLRDIAFENNLRPYEVFDILQKGTLSE